MSEFPCAFVALERPFPSVNAKVIEKVVPFMKILVGIILWIPAVLVVTFEYLNLSVCCRILILKDSVLGHLLLRTLLDCQTFLVKWSAWGNFHSDIWEITKSRAVITKLRSFLFFRRLKVKIRLLWIRRRVRFYQWVRSSRRRCGMLNWFAFWAHNHVVSLLFLFILTDFGLWVHDLIELKA